MGGSESEARQDALRQVLAQAGFPNVILCPNPIAAGCFLQFSGAVPPEAKQNVMVYDFDSLSSSAAIVRVEPQKLPVLEGWSEQSVGGRRFLDLLFGHFKRKIESENTGAVLQGGVCGGRSEGGTSLAMCTWSVLLTRHERRN